MPRLHRLFTFPRVVRHSSAVGADLPRDDAVDLDAPDPALRGALTAAGRGGHSTARSLLAATRERADWHRRSEYVYRLADFAVKRPDWLDDWRREAPEDPDAWLVAAELTVLRAWAIRTGARAKDVSREQFQAFHTLLSEGTETIRRAAELNPEDPVPWRIALNHARGLQAPREVFDEYLMQVLDRDPQHYFSHSSALQYVCRKWNGSHEEMFDFAEAAADRATPGTLLGALPIEAVTEYALDHGVGEGPIPASRIDAAVDRTLALSRSFRYGDPVAAGFRNHLAFALIRAERWEEALEEFRAIGTHARRQPWGYLGDALAVFWQMRTGVRTRLAARTPFFAELPPHLVTGPEPVVNGDGAPVPYAALAFCTTTLPKAENAALLTGLNLRMAPAPGGGTFVELAPSADVGRRRGLRGALLGQGSMEEVARRMSTGEEWPVVVLERTPDWCGVSLFRNGEERAANGWFTVGLVPDMAEATAAARAFAEAYGLDDHRPLVRALRTDGAGSDLPAAPLWEALGLPGLPEGFPERAEALTDVRGAKLVRRRSFLAAVKESLADDEDDQLPDLKL